MPQYVLLVTDGDPNCMDVQDQVQGLARVPDPSARQASMDAVSALAQDNVHTYVIGYDTEPFKDVLDALAVLGNTGDTAHRQVTNGEQLLAEFKSIAAAAVSCSFALVEPADFSKVKVYLDGQDTTYGEDWTLQGDGQTVELLGGACEALQFGATLEAEVVCEVVNVL